MAAEVAAAAISAGAALAGSAANQIAVGRANKRGQKLFHEQIQNQWNMWDATNRYNSYENQIRLMQQAGINPAYMYGQGNGTDGTASQSSGPSAPNMQAANFDGMAAGIGNAANLYLSNQVAQKELLLKDKELGIKADAVAVQEYEAKTHFYKALSDMGVNDETIELIKAQKGTEIARAANLQKEGVILDEQGKQAVIDSYVAEMTKDERIKSFMLANKLTEAQLKEALAHANLMNAQEVAQALANIITRETSAATIAGVDLENKVKENEGYNQDMGDFGYYVDKMLGIVGQVAGFAIYHKIFGGEKLPKGMSKKEYEEFLIKKFGKVTGSEKYVNGGNGIN